MQVVLDLQNFQKQRLEYAEDLADFAYTHDVKLHANPPDPKALALEADRLAGPDAGSVVLHQDAEGIQALVSRLLENRRDPGFGERLTLVRKLQDYGDFLTEVPKSREEHLHDLLSEAQRSLVELQQNLEHFKSQIEEAIRSIPTWETPQVVLQPYFSKDNPFTTSPSVTVSLGSSEDDPSFTAFLNGDHLAEIDDLLEGGDTDFFHDPGVQADYFALVNELRHPGSAARGKNLVLWTARPSTDRMRYENATTLPTNLFLTTKENTALGLAHDLGGSEVRDVWRVVINSKYLVVTRDGGPYDRDYQTVGRGPVPVEKMTLVHVGDSASRVASRYLRRVADQTSMPSRG